MMQIYSDGIQTVLTLILIYQSGIDKFNCDL